MAIPGISVSHNVFFLWSSMSLTSGGLVVSVYPLSLNRRPNAVSSGGTVWQASQAKPVCRAKGGTARAGVETSVSADPQTRNAATTPRRHDLTAADPSSDLDS